MQEPLFAETIVTTWKDLVADESRGVGCPTVRQIEDYASGQTALLPGSAVLEHGTACSVCRNRLAALDRMESRSEGITTWRLYLVRPMARIGSARASEVASRIGDWLPELAGDGPTQIDSQGRLLLSLTLDIPQGASAQATVSLADETHCLELFTVRVEGRALEAIVDLLCCSSSALSISPDALRVDLIDVVPGERTSPTLTTELEMIVPGRPLDLNAVDRLLTMASDGLLSASSIREEITAATDPDSTIRVLSAARELLARYVSMSVTGNKGEVPEAAYGLLVTITSEIARENATTETPFGITAQQPVRYTDTARHAKRKRTEEERPR